MTANHLSLDFPEMSSIVAWRHWNAQLAPILPMFSANSMRREWIKNDQNVEPVLWCSTHLQQATSGAKTLQSLPVARCSLKLRESASAVPIVLTCSCVCISTFTSDPKVQCDPPLERHMKSL